MKKHCDELRDSMSTMRYGIRVADAFDSVIHQMNPIST